MYIEQEKEKHEKKFIYNISIYLLYRNNNIFGRFWEHIIWKENNNGNAAISFPLCCKLNLVCDGVLI